MKVLDAAAMATTTAIDAETAKETEKSIYSLLTLLPHYNRSSKVTSQRFYPSSRVRILIWR